MQKFKTVRSTPQGFAPIQNYIFPRVGVLPYKNYQGVPMLGNFENTTKRYQDLVLWVIGPNSFSLPTGANSKITNKLFRTP